jgi:hypothetical protein
MAWSSHVVCILASSKFAAQLGLLGHALFPDLMHILTLHKNTYLIMLVIC